METWGYKISCNVGCHQICLKYCRIFCELTSNMSAQNLSLWARKQIDIFEDIQKEFIAAVFDSLASPTNLTCHLTGNSSLLLSRNRLDTLLEKNNKLYTGGHGRQGSQGSCLGWNIYQMHETHMSRLFMNHPFIQSFVAHWSCFLIVAFKKWEFQNLAHEWENFQSRKICGRSKWMVPNTMIE